MRVACCVLRVEKKNQSQSLKHRASFSTSCVDSRIYSSVDRGGCWLLLCLLLMTGRVLAFTLFIINDGEGVGFYFYRGSIIKTLRSVKKFKNF